MVGDEATLRAGIARLREVGVTDFNAAMIPFGDAGMEPLMELLQSEI
jgi:hypothetical protein